MVIYPAALYSFQQLYDDFYKSFIYAERWKLYVSGLGRTLEVALLSILLGIVLGVIVALIRVAHDQNRNKNAKLSNAVLAFFNSLCKIYTTVIRGTPMMVQLMILGFVIFKSSRNFTMVGALGLGINSGAYVSEIIRSGLMSVDVGQSEAGRSLGLSYIQTLRHIIIPQAIKNVLPALGNEFIVLLKDTSLITVIAGKEILYAAKAVAAKTYSYMFPLIGVAVVYLILVVVLTWLQGILEKRLRASDHR